MAVNKILSGFGAMGESFAKYLVLDIFDFGGGKKYELDVSETSAEVRESDFDAIRELCQQSLAEARSSNNEEDIRILQIIEQINDRAADRVKNQDSHNMTRESVAQLLLDSYNDIQELTSGSIGQRTR